MVIIIHIIPIFMDEKLNSNKGISKYPYQFENFAICNSTKSRELKSSNPLKLHEKFGYPQIIFHKILATLQHATENSGATFYIHATDGYIQRHLHM